MRQTLLRIRLGELWSLEPVNNVTAIGIGYLLVPWMLIGLWWGWRYIVRSGWKPEYISSVVTWAIVGLVIFMTPSVAGDRSIPIFGYGFMMFCGFAAGGWTAGRRAQKYGYDPNLIWDLAIWVFFSGIIGARLLYLIQYGDRVFAGAQGIGGLLFAAINLPDGGLIFYGGVIVGTVAFFAFCRRRQIGPLELSDLAVPSVFLGMAFGRFGCFLNGCCYGDRCTLPWAVTFPEGSVPYLALLNRGFLEVGAAASLPLHPTQLYSVINGLALAALTSAIYATRPRHGIVTAIALTLYPLTRIIIEFLRGDEMGQMGTALTISQWISMGVLLFGAVLWFVISGKPRSNKLKSIMPKGRSAPA